MVSQHPNIKQFDVGAYSVDSFHTAPSSMVASTSTIYMPITSPPTPAPSPRPHHYLPLTPNLISPASEFSSLSEFATLSPSARLDYLAQLLGQCNSKELSFVSSKIAPWMKRDFLRELPVELGIHILEFVDDVGDLARNIGRVSKYWRQLSQDECLWRSMCFKWGFMTVEDLTSSAPLSFFGHFKSCFLTRANWQHGGTLMRSHRLPIIQPDQGVVTSLAMDDDWIVVGLASCKIHVFSRRTGVLSRTLVGCQGGVWAVWLIGSGGTPLRQDDLENDDEVQRKSNIPESIRIGIGLDPEDTGGGESSGSRDKRRSSRSSTYDVSSSSDGYGQPNALVVSGGCDKIVRVWDALSGFCVHVLHGHTSTIRCIKVLNNRPIAVSGSRDCTLRVWDVRRGRLLRVLEGHTQSVRCLDVHGSRVVSGSYDHTCRIWDVDTGECIHVLRGHFNQIYCVVFDGERIASAGLDTTIRIWDAESGQCVALLQGHTALVCQIQLSPTILATGGSDGRVITFSLENYSTLQRIAAHDSSVTALQFDENFLVTGGNDGRVRLFETKTGRYIRDLSENAECVWKVGYKGDVCAIMCKRGGKTVMEIWNYKPKGGL